MSLLTATNASTLGKGAKSPRKEWHHGFEETSWPLPTVCLPGDMKQNIARFIIVIMTSKRLPAPNEIT